MFLYLMHLQYLPYTRICRHTTVHSVFWCAMRRTKRNIHCHPIEIGVTYFFFPSYSRQLHQLVAKYFIFSCNLLWRQLISEFVKVCMCVCTLYSDIEVKVMQIGVYSSHPFRFWTEDKKTNQSTFCKINTGFETAIYSWILNTSHQ